MYAWHRTVQTDRSKIIYVRLTLSYNIRITDIFTPYTYINVLSKVTVTTDFFGLETNPRKVARTIKG